MNNIIKFPPTKRQKELLDFIKNYLQENQEAPSFNDMVLGTSIKSKSNIHDNLEALQERGLIQRLRGRKRAIVVIL